MNSTITALYDKYRNSGHVSTDTRNIIPGAIFFALKGDNFNANTFAKQALEKGAAYAVIDDAAYATEGCMVVENVLETLQQLARYHRDKFTIPVIALTGSNGKTTSKELLHAVLSKKYKTHATKGNLNNHIGVPLTLLAMPVDTEIAIIEMGANHVGEIAALSNIANPTHGFITNIGKAHIGTFGGAENIIRGKSELYQHLITTQGQVFINSQNHILYNMSKRFASPVFYPAAGDYYHAERLASHPYVKVKAENGDEIQTHLIGDYNFENIAAALCIGKYFGVDAAQANAAVAAYVPGNMRSQLIEKGTNQIILDAYNANPSSMQAAIENLAAMESKNKVLIIGDMFELGDEADAEHYNIGKLIYDKHIQDVFLCGTLFKSALRALPQAQWFADKNALIEKLKSTRFESSVILVKASRGIGLETVVDYL